MPSDAAARTFVDDLALFGGAATVLPEPDGAAYAELAADRAADAARLAVLYALGQGGPAAPRTVVVSGAALIKKTLPPAELAARAIALGKGQTIDRDATATRLLECGFARAPVVDDPYDLDVLRYDEATDSYEYVGRPAGAPARAH